MREYFVWRTEEDAVDWFILRDGNFVPLPIADDGLIRSETFPGLCLDPQALLKGDLARLFQVIDAAVNTEQHAAFVARLRG